MRPGEQITDEPYAAGLITEADAQQHLDRLLAQREAVEALDRALVTGVVPDVVVDRTGRVLRLAP